MTKIPLIVSFGGINAAGRSSMHLGYRRLVESALPPAARREMVLSLAALTDTKFESFECEDDFEQAVLDNSLVRRIGIEHFDVDQVPGHQAVDLNLTAAVNFTMRKRALPKPLPAGWVIVNEYDDKVDIKADNVTTFVETTRQLAVSAAGTVPTGFDPGSRYASRHHPRALQLNMFAASDAVQALGIPWDTIRQRVAPDKIAVFAGSAMGQLDDQGLGGLSRARWQGNRPTSKQCPLGLVEMPADFVNAYLLGSVGTTGTGVGACASFLYNLRMGIEAIRSSEARVVFVGNAEAPVLPEVIESYAAMSALATDDALAKQSEDGEVNHRQASRPFGVNAGFTIAESAQYCILMADDLALELGAEIHGAATDVFVNADGFKRSISAPGVGNYITMSKAVAAAVQTLGKESVTERSFVQAHGSSTPQNRVTESAIFDRVATANDIKSWPVSAVKSYLGHSLGPASGDQLSATLGVWKYGILPAINNLNEVASDVHSENIHFLTEHMDVGPEAMDVAFLNAKGFGGNNATGVIVAPHKVKDWLKARYGDAAYNDYLTKLSVTQQYISDYAESVVEGRDKTDYVFGQGVLADDDVILTSSAVKLTGIDCEIDLADLTPYRFNC